MQTRNGFGEGGAPALHGNFLVVNWDHEGEDFVAAFDKRTGKELWAAEARRTTTWTTPLVVEHGGKAQVVVSATQRVRSYDLESGERDLGVRRHDRQCDSHAGDRLRARVCHQRFSRRGVARHQAGVRRVT